MSLASIRAFASRLRSLPKVVAIKIAVAAADAINEVARETFDAGADAYGVPWAPSSDGQRVSMYKSGALSKGVRYVAVGGRLRAVLSTPYAKYQIGRRPVFPRAGAILPLRYSAALTKATERAIAEHIGGAT